MPRKSAALLLSGFLATFGLSSGSAQVTPEHAFWNWFQKNEATLFDFEKDQERIFDRLSAELQKIDPNLTFEFGPQDNGRREFTISADGIRKAFPAVEKLYAAAPSMPRDGKFRNFARAENQRIFPSKVSVWQQMESVFTWQKMAKK